MSRKKPDTPIIELHEGFQIVREDLVPGGTKARILPEILKDIDADEFVYPSTTYGYGPLAVAHAAKELGKKAVLFYPARNRENWTPMMEEAESIGAEIVMVKMGFMSVLKCRANEYCEENSRAHMVPLGCDTAEFHQGFVDLAKSLRKRPKEVWCAAGTGALTRALQEAWPNAEHHAVVVAMKTADTGTAIRHTVKIPFERAAKNMPPFPSAANYDAKVWEVMKEHASPKALFWNVGA
jgi:threonine dehydratase